MKKLLVTGGAGFIGSHFVIEAVKKGYQVYNLDALTYAANLNYLKTVDSAKNYHFINGDIREDKFILKLFLEHKFDYVAHLAAESHVDKSISDPNIFVETNVLGTHNLLVAARETGVKRFLHVSTDEVYGHLQLGDLEFTEDHPIKPNSPYSASKASSDLLVRSYIKTYDFPALITRCSNNYGPHQDLSKLIPVVISKALKSEKIPVYGKGLNIRDWLYVKDHVSALFRVLEEGTLGEIYNIGGNNEMTNLDLVKIILDKLQRPYSLIEFVRDRPGHDFRYAINANKIKSELNWEPNEDFHALLEETINWYIKEL